MNDLANIKPGERTIEILHPSTGEKLGLRITIMSTDDDRMRKINRRITDEALRKRQKNKAFSAEEIEDNALALIVQAVTGWEWYGDDVSFEGEKPDYSPINVRKVVTKAAFIRSQLEEELGETKSFFQN